MKGIIDEKVIDEILSSIRGKRKPKTDLYTFFEHLKQALHLPEELELRWLPTDKQKPCRGLVSKDHRTIFVFDEDEEEAKETLLHEIVELLITNFIIAGTSIKRTDEFYNLREVVVEALRKMISEEEIIKRTDINELIRLLKEYGGEDLVE